jgi:hypothetical protein
MERNIKSVFVDTRGQYNTIEEVDLAYKGIYTLYKYLNCSTFTVATRKIGESTYDVYCDDEALLKQDPVVAMASEDLSEMLFGNCLILRHDDDGNVAPLTDEDVSDIMDNIRSTSRGDEVIVYTL